MNTHPDTDGITEECDHEWRYQRDDFDHEFGTERVRYWMCELCGETCGERDHQPDVDPPDPPDWEHRYDPA